MSILIIGANGQVGKHCIEQALKRSLAYTACTRSELELTSRTDISNYITQLNPSAVINCAAYTAVDKAETEQLLASQINTLAPEAMAKACQNLDIPFVHISTDYVFSGDKIGSYTELDSVSPINHYGHSKLQGEVAVLKSCDKAFVLRTSWVFSEYGNNFVKTMLKLAQAHDSLNIVDDQWGCPTYAGTIAETIFTLLEKSKTNTNENAGLYHLCDQGRTSWYSFAKEIFSLAFADNTITKIPRLTGIPSSDYPTPAPRPKNSELCSLKLENTFAIKLPLWNVTLRKALSKLETQH
jgi:dTDP-4-dehydrorhamnose reductase